MRHTSQLLCFGHFGQPQPPVFSFNITGDRVLAGAQARGGFRGLKRCAEGDIPQVKIHRSGKVRYYDNPGDINHAEIMLGYTIVVPYTPGSPTGNPQLNAQQNPSFYDHQPYTLTQTVGQNTLPRLPLYALPHVYDNKPGYLQYQSLGNTPWGYTGYPIQANTAFTVRFTIFQVPDGQDFDLFQLRFNPYQVNFVNGASEIMRLAPDVTNSDGTITPGWNQSQEDALSTLLAIDDPTADDETSIESLRQAIYKDYQSISFGDDFHEAAYKRYSLTFIPVATGRLLCINGRGQVHPVNHTDITLSRQPGTLWPNTQLEIRRNGGAASWQYGYPQFKLGGKLILPPFASGYWSGVLGALITQLQAYIPPGTAITAALDDSGGTSQIVLTFTTDNPRQTPFLYHAFAYTQGGARDGATATVLDTTSTGDPTNDPILEVTPSYESDNGSSTLLKTQFEVEVRDVDGQTFAGITTPDLVYETAENRLTTLKMDGDKVLARGLVKLVTWQDVADFTGDRIRANVTAGRTKALLTICGQEVILEEQYTNDEIGDGLYLGAYLIAMLTNLGYSGGDLAGISPTAGRILPQAFGGEEPCVRPGQRSKYADHIRDVLTKYGMGWWLYWDSSVGNGQWTFAPRPTTISSLYGHELRFVNPQPGYDAHSYPGRFALLQQLDAPRDCSDFYNFIQVVGGEDALGNKLTQWWRANESIVFSSTLSRDFIGRVRPLIIEDTGLRTADDVAWALRSAVMQYGIPPRFHKFETYFIPLLRPGLVCSVGGLFSGAWDYSNAPLCRVESLSGAMNAGDTMTVTCRELV